MEKVSEVWSVIESNGSLNVLSNGEEVLDLAKLARGIENDNFEKLARGIDRFWSVFQKPPKKSSIC